MRILMITHYFYPRIGGVEKVIMELVENLPEHTISIITEKHESNLKDIEKFNSWTKVYRFQYPHKKYIGLIYIWKWIFNNRKLIKESDIIHIHDVFVWYLPFRFLYFSKPVYTTFHGWEGKLPIPITSLIQKRIAFLFSKKVIIVGKYLEKYYKLKADVITYNGTNIDKKQTQKIPDSFVYVGRLSDDTGLDLILTAISNSNNIKIEFLGDGELRNKCSQYGRVRGFVERPSDFLSKAEYCFAGGYLTILEAFAHKCLVFVCYQNSLKEDYFKNSPFSKYMIIAESPEELIRKIKFYQTHKNQKIKKIEAAYRWVQDQTWENLTKQYKKLWAMRS